MSLTLYTRGPKNKKDYKRDGELFFQEKDDLRPVIWGEKLSPNISLRALPLSQNLTNLATIVALCITWFISFSLHKRFTSCILLRFESNEMPHSSYSLILSLSESLLCISFTSIPLSRRSAFTLYPQPSTYIKRNTLVNKLTSMVQGKAIN